jgi:DNA-binding beta-propeller fold protein YncE
LALVLGWPGEVAAIDPDDGTVLFDGPGVLPATDASTVVTAEVDDGRTSIRTVEAATGEVVSTASVRGELAIRVVSGDGRRAALMAPVPPGTDPWMPTPRTTTDVVVADTSGIVDPRRYHLNGNLEPEAFSEDGGSLFMIRYLPAEAPVAYRVVQLELEDGDVYPVLGRLKSWSQRMAGTRLAQAAAADGTGLYTLYTSQPAPYAAGFDPEQANAKRSVAFVHSLSLSRGFAVCVGLPKPLWGADPEQEAIAVAPDGGRVYVVDTALGIVVVMDTWKLRVVRTEHVDGLPAGGGQVAAGVTPDGSTLFVAQGSEVAEIGTSTLRVRATRSTPGSVSAMGFSPDGGTMWLGLPDRVEAMAIATWTPGATITAPNAGAPTFVGPIPA